MTPVFEHYRAIRVERGLYVVESKGGTTYAARCRIKGKWHYTSCDTADFKTAETAAVRWYRSLQSTAGKGHELMRTATTTFIASVIDVRKRTGHEERWETIREYFSPGMGRPELSVVDVDSPTLLKFVDWRRQHNPTIKPGTLHKDLVTVRAVLRFAVMRGTLPTLPQFPGVHVLGKIDPNPRPWLTADEWQHLQRVAERRITDAPNARWRLRRQELLVFLRFMYATCLRVDEARSIRRRDVTVRYTEPEPREVIERRLKRAKPGEVVSVQTRYLDIDLKRGKTGPRPVKSRAVVHPSVVKWIEAQSPNDPLFTGGNYQESFRSLLTAANLRITEYGKRNLKAMRPTGISHWLLAKPQLPLTWLARNVGTSTQMLDLYYVRRLGIGSFNDNAWL